MSSNCGGCFGNIASTNCSIYSVLLDVTDMNCHVANCFGKFKQLIGEVARFLDIANQELEEVCIFIEFGKVNYCVGTLYILPSMDYSVYAAHLETIEKVNKVLVFRNFNLPLIQWTISEDISIASC